MHVEWHTVNGKCTLSVIRYPLSVYTTSSAMLVMIFIPLSLSSLETGQNILFPIGFISPLASIAMRMIALSQNLT